MAETRPKNYPKLKNYVPSQFMLPNSHYNEEKANRAVKFIENLCHTKGQWAGKRFWLLPWQEQIVRDVFGIVNEDGTRQFRTAFIEIPKKNGKSELAAALALYLLYADDEPSQQRELTETLFVMNFIPRHSIFSKEDELILLSTRSFMALKTIWIGRMRLTGIR